MPYYEKFCEIKKCGFGESGPLDFHPESLSKINFLFT